MMAHVAEEPGRLRRGHGGVEGGDDESGRQQDEFHEAIRTGGDFRGRRNRLLRDDGGGRIHGDDHARNWLAGQRATFSFALVGVFVAMWIVLTVAIDYYLSRQPDEE